MPSPSKHGKHVNRALTPRPPEDVREGAVSAARRMGTPLNAVIVAFLRWYGGLTDELPERPERDHDDRLG
jgi:hypothetical protein